MTPAIARVKAKVEASPSPIRIVFPEGWNASILKAAWRLNNGKIRPVLLVKDKNQITREHDGLEVISIADYDLKSLAEQLFELRKAKGLTLEQAQKLVLLPNYFGTLLVKNGVVDGYVGGIEMTTKETVLPALQIVKTNPSAKLVSSVLVMEKDGLVHAYGDCSINTNPDGAQLKEIAKAVVFFAKHVLEFKDINLAMLSYSTVGSGSGPDVDKVQEAVRLANEDPNFGATVDGEYQFDSAFDHNVRAKKAPKSMLPKNGPANVYIFPDLNAGNIGYKIAQRIGGMSAVGPVLIGLAAPINDLSRGASVDDVEGVAYLTAAQVMAEQAAKNK